MACPLTGLYRKHSKSNSDILYETAYYEFRLSNVSTKYWIDYAIVKCNSSSLFFCPIISNQRLSESGQVRYVVRFSGCKLTKQRKARIRQLLENNFDPSMGFSSLCSILPILDDEFGLGWELTREDEPSEKQRHILPYSSVTFHIDGFPGNFRLYQSDRVLLSITR